MGRGKSKGKKLSMNNQYDTGSGEEEKIPAQKRRGRPQKPLKDDIENEDAQKLEDEYSEESNGLTDGKKRKMSAQIKAKVEENENGTTKSSIDESKKSNGFRLSSSRRKNKPHRAAEAVLECN